MKLKNTIILGLFLISTNTLSDGKWLDWGESSMTNLDKITSISGGILFKNRCNNGYSWTLREWIKSYREGTEYHGGFYTREKPKTANINNYVSSYKHSFSSWVSSNPTLSATEADRKTYKYWIKTGFGGAEIQKVFQFEEHWLESTDESYYSEIVLGDQTIWLSQGLCGDGEVISEKSANELVQDNLDDIRDFLDDDDTYRRLK
jgi:hypothetical protein